MNSLEVLLKKIQEKIMHHEKFKNDDKAYNLYIDNKILGFEECKDLIQHMLNNGHN